MDAINISTIITALTYVWTTAQHTRDFPAKQAQLRSSMEAVYRQSLMQLQPLIPQMGPQVISNILWSSAKVGFTPDDAVPGMVSLLTRAYLELVAAADTLEDKKAPNAQDSANFLWALVTMDPSAATQEVADAVVMHFAGLNHSSDVRRRPNTQEVANIMWASAQMQKTFLVPTKLLDPICDRFADLLHSPDARQRPTAQDCSNMIWSLATIGHPAAPKLLSTTCAHFAQLMHSPDARQRPDAQAIANLMWALAKLRHAPPDAAASAMLQRFIAVCEESGHQPRSQNIRNTICACAELRSRVTQQESDVLLNMLLDMPATRVNVQEYCNSAWGLAVVQHLTVTALALCWTG